MAEIFLFPEPHSVVSAVTNSSSEIFVVKSKKQTLRDVEAALDALYVEWAAKFTNPEPMGCYVAEATKDDVRTWKYYNDSYSHGPRTIKVGDIVIRSDSSNSIPWDFMELIENRLQAIRRHLG